MAGWQTSPARLPIAPSPAWQRLTQADEADLRIANARLDVVMNHLHRHPTNAGSQVPERTVREWTARFKLAQQQTGRGYLGLLPNITGRGNRNRKLPEDSIRLMNDCIEKEYETLTQKTRFAAWVMLKQKCDAEQVVTPS
jgi:putative transposase